MPHATADVVDSAPSPGYARKINVKTKSTPREILKLSQELQSIQMSYQESELATAIRRHLNLALKRSTTRITRIVSLGLGSLNVAKDRARRLKQLSILLALRNQLEQVLGTHIDVYAQDPTFSRVDESFLSMLDIQVLRTSSGSSLGEAATFISDESLIYIPFLTIEAYEQLLSNAGSPSPLIFGDDFDSLLKKWPKHSAERRQVESVMKSGLGRYRRRAINGDGFWQAEDESFPMAMYEPSYRGGQEKLKAKI